MKSGSLDQSRFKSGHQIGQTSRLKRRLDLGRRIFCTTDLNHRSSNRYIDRYIENIADIFDISAIYLPKNRKKCFPRACLPRVDISTDMSPRFRYFADISTIFANFLRFVQQTTLYIKNRFGSSRYTKYRRNIGRYFRHFNHW